MNEELENLMMEFSLGIISDEDQKKLNNLLKLASDEGKTESTKIYKAINSFALSTYQVDIPIQLKEKIFAELPTSDTKKKLETKKHIKLKPIQLISTIAATILISVSITRSFSPISENKSDKLRNEKLVQFAHLKKVEKIALCSQVNEKLMKQTSSTAFTAFTAGKIYINISKKSLVLHICKLPKLENQQCFTLWSVGQNGISQVLHNIDLSEGITERNFIFTKIPKLSPEMDFIISIENKTNFKAQKPSKKVLLKS